MEEKYDLLQMGQTGDYEKYEVMPSTVVDAVEGVQTEFITRYGKDSDGGFADAEDDDLTLTISIGGRQYQYVPWGGDNMLPYHVQVLIGKNMVTSQCQQFNSLTCYDQGLQFFERGTSDKPKRASDPEIRSFCLRNALHLQFWEQATDMKYYFFSVLVITLSRDGKRLCSCAIRMPATAASRPGTKREVPTMSLWLTGESPTPRGPWCFRFSTR